MNIYFCIIIFLFYIIKSSYSNVIKFNFEKYKTNIVDINSLKYHSSNYPNNITLKNDYIFKILTDDLYINLTIGTPPQNINTIWNMNTYSFKIYSSSFNYNISSTYKNISSNFIYSFDEVKDALLCNDIFYFFDEYNNKYSKNFQFINIKNSEKNYSIIGLQLANIIADNLLTFIKDMKQNNIIDKYIFFILYNKDINIENPEGQLFFGEYPHNIKILNNKYKIKNYHEIKAGNRNKLIYWDILFDNIYFNNNNNSKAIKYKQVELLGNMQLSIGTEEYYKFIQKIFFEKYINENICEEKIILDNTDYIYYKCKKIEEFNITSFPEIFFELKEINFNFSLNYNDLFFIHDDFIFFGIIFDKYFKLKFNQRWKLGSAIFKKYLLVFNQDSKTIGFYDNIINKIYLDPINKNIQNKKNYKINIIKAFSIIILLIIIIICFIFIKRGIIKWKGNKNSKKINYNKITKITNIAYNKKNKKEIHNYYELNDKLI
jgi:hypothetical protein